jgi:hypothetical protein
MKQILETIRSMQKRLDRMDKRLGFVLDTSELKDYRR